MPNINIDDAYILNETGAQVDKVTGLFTKDEETTEEEKAFAKTNIGLTESTETQTYGEVKIRKYGKVVVANGYVTNLAITGSSTNLPFTINPQFRPTEGIRTIANIGANAYSVNTIAYVTITTSGVISVSPPSGATGNTYTTFYGNFSWIIA